MALTIAIPIGPREPIGDFESLVIAVKEALDRDDLTKVQVSNFIALAEAKFNRRLRVPWMEKIVTLDVLEGANSLSIEDCLRVRTLWNGDCAIVQQIPGAVIPSAYYTTSGKTIRFHTPFKEDRKLTILYHAKIPAVNENNADNWLLNDHPDIYYYGTLLQAEAFIVNDERVPMWATALEDALAELEQAGLRDRYSGSPLVPQGRVVQVRGARI